MQTVRTIGRVLGRPAYGLTALLIAFLVFTVAVIVIPSFGLIADTATASAFSLIDKIEIIVSLYAAIGSNTTALSASIIIVISVLFGINLSLFLFIIKRKWRALTTTETGGSVAGLVSGLLGIGCAACGSLLLTAVLPTTAAGVLASLPFSGQELGFVGIALIGYSCWSLAQTAGRPAGTCAV